MCLDEQLILAFVCCAHLTTIVYTWNIAKSSILLRTFDEVRDNAVDFGLRKPEYIDASCVSYFWSQFHCIYSIYVAQNLFMNDSENFSALRHFVIVLSRLGHIIIE